MGGGGGGRGPGPDEDDIDHYTVLGLPSGEEGSTLTLKQIEKAYRTQSRIRHPDKRPDDPNATADFQRLTSSFEVLRDEPKRRAFDALLRTRRERLHRESLYDAKRRKLASDLDERERAAAAEEVAEKAERKEKRVADELKKELADFRERKAKKASTASSTFSQSERVKEENEGPSLDKERVLKVSWEREMGDYGAVKLRELFERFGGVEDVVIRSKGLKKRASAIIVMSSKEAAVAATHIMSGDISNPLLVLPVQAAASNLSSSFPERSAESISPKLGNIVGAGFQDFEASIMKKLAKAKEMKKTCSSTGD